jgi:hypothetical protein
MKELITKIFTESHFELTGEKANTFFFENANENQASYYLVHFTGVSTLKNYIAANNLDESFTLIEEKQKLKPDVEKNTSLIICAITENLNDSIQELKNDILFLEEDEYWFKKYVLLYTDKCLEKFKTGSEILPLLSSALLNSAEFHKFHENLYENEEYYFVAEIFLKLSFLSVPVSLHEQYLSINQILTTNLSEDEIALLHNVVEHQTEIEGDYWEKIRIANSKLTNTEEVLTDLFEKFKSND